MAQYLNTPPATPAKIRPASGYMAANNASFRVGKTNVGQPKRFQKKRLETVDNIRRASIRKLARRGGVKRIKQSVYQTTKEVIEDQIRNVIRRCVLIMSPSGRKIITSLDIVYALKDMPSMRAGLQPVYGFGWPVKEFPEPRVRTLLPRQSDSQDILKLKQRIAAAEASEVQLRAPIPTPTPPPSPTPRRSAKTLVPVDMPDDDAENDADDDDDMTDDESESKSRNHEDKAGCDSEDERRIEANFQDNIARVAEWQRKMDAINAAHGVFVPHSL